MEKNTNSNNNRPAARFLAKAVAAFATSAVLGYAAKSVAIGQGASPDTARFIDDLVSVSPVAYYGFKILAYDQ